MKYNVGLFLLESLCFVFGVLQDCVLLYVSEMILKVMVNVGKASLFGYPIPHLDASNAPLVGLLFMCSETLTDDGGASVFPFSLKGHMSLCVTHQPSLANHEHRNGIQVTNTCLQQSNFWFCAHPLELDHMSFTLRLRSSEGS